MFTVALATPVRFLLVTFAVGSDAFEGQNCFIATLLDTFVLMLFFIEDKANTFNTLKNTTGSMLS